MARPVNADPAATRRRILDAAAALFAASGETSIRDVAARSKVSVATIHHHFGNKEGLWAACVESMYAELAELRLAILEGFQGGGEFEEQIRRAVESLYRAARRHQPAIRLILRNVLETGEIGVPNQERKLLPMLDQGASLFHDLTGRPPEELRLAIQSVVFLVGRYAIASSRELAMVAGAPRRASADDVHAAVGRHLGDCAVRLVCRVRTL